MPRGLIVNVITEARACRRIGSFVLATSALWRRTPSDLVLYVLRNDTVIASSDVVPVNTTEKGTSLSCVAVLDKKKDVSTSEWFQSVVEGEPRVFLSVVAVEHDLSLPHH